MPSSLHKVVEECVGKSLWGLKGCPSPLSGQGTQFCFRTGLDTVPLFLMVNSSARQVQSGQRESFGRLKQALPLKYKVVWCVREWPMKPMGLALELGEEAGQNSPTASCRVLPKSSPRLRWLNHSPERVFPGRKHRKDMAGKTNNSTLHYILSTLMLL